MNIILEVSSRRTVLCCCLKYISNAGMLGDRANPAGESFEDFGTNDVRCIRVRIATMDITLLAYIASDTLIHVFISFSLVERFTAEHKHRKTK